MTRTLALCLLFALAPAALAGPPGPPPHPPRPPHGPPPPGAPGHPPIPPSVIEETRANEDAILVWAEANAPESHALLLSLRGADPRAYLGQLVRVSRTMERSERDPEVVARLQRMRQLDEQLHERSADWDELDAKAQKARRAELLTLATELFEIRQQERRAHLEELQERIEELRSEIERRDADRAAIVDDFVDDLVRGEAEL